METDGGVTSGSVLGLVLFLVYIKELANRLVNRSFLLAGIVKIAQPLDIGILKRNKTESTDGQWPGIRLLT